MNTDNNGFVFRTTALIASVAMNVLLSLAVPATSAAETTAANRAAANVSDPAGSVFQDRGDQPPGALRVSAQGHWLEFRGRPFVPVGDSLTQGWMELGSDFDQQAYLDALARRRINTVLLWSYIGITDQLADERIGYDAPELWPWITNGGRFDLGHLNDAYFERLREFVRLADARNIVVVITVHDGWTKTKFAGHPFGRSNGGPLDSREQYVALHDYGREIPGTPDSTWAPRRLHQYYLERFCDRLLRATADLPNVMYEMFNEGEWYDQSKLRAFQVHFLAFFRARTARPLLVNDDHVGGSEFREEALASVISLHKPLWDELPGGRVFFEHYQSQFFLRPHKPVVFSEPVPSYLGDPMQYAGIVRLLWGTALGGAGVVVQNDTSWGFAPRAAMARLAAQRDAVLDLEGHLARFLHGGDVDFWKMQPAGRLASTGVCLANAGREYVVFVPDGERFTVDLSDGSGMMLSVRWYDPASGEVTDGGEVAGGGSAERFQPPFARNAVLHLRRRA